MGMLSYKQYKLLQENLDGVIGLTSRGSLGVVSEAPQLFGMMKKMKGDAPDMGMGKPGMGKPALDDMTGDKNLDDEDELGDEEGFGDDDLGDEDHPHDEEGEDLDGDEEGADDDADLDDEGDGDADDMGMGMGMGGDMGPLGAGSPPPGMGGPMDGPAMPGGLGGPLPKKKPPMMMKKMMGGGPMYMKKEAADPQDAKMKKQNSKNKANDQDIDKPGSCDKKTTFVREGCCDKCGNMMNKCCKKSKKMTKEQREFEESLKRQAGSLKFKQDELGYWVPVNEDVLLPAAQQKQETPNDEPQPGEVGFAPQAKIGIVGSNFQEWANRHHAAVKNRK